MNTKYSIKILSLYDIIINNYLLIISTIHHLIILLFNYYSIIHLDFLQKNFNQFKINFELIQYNFEICQSITLITAFFVIYFSQPILDKHISKNKYMFFIMFISFFIKMSFTFYQYITFKHFFIKPNIEQYISFGLFYNFIEFTYAIRVYTFLVIIFLSLTVPLILECEHLCNKITKWSKNYTINFIQEHKNDGSEDV